MRALHIPRPQKSLAPWPLPMQHHGPRQMADPPAIAITNTPTLPRRWPIGTGLSSWPVTAVPMGGNYTISRGIPAADGGPTLAYAAGDTVTQNREGVRAPSSTQISFYHEGERLELHFQIMLDNFLLKIDGEYVSIDPLTASGTNPHFLIEFGSRRLRRIDIVTFKSPFIQARTQPGDALYAAPVRGPRMIVVGDSFTTSDPDSWVNWFADGMGWDDVWASGVGGSGYCSDALGNRLTFIERVQADVIDHRPDIVFIHGSVNDLGFTPAEVREAARTYVSTVRRALPDCLVAGGINTPYGVEFWHPSSLDVVDALREGFESAGGAWMTPLEMPMTQIGEPIGIRATLSASIIAGRPGNSGTPDQVDVASGFRINSDPADPGTILRTGSTVEIGTGATRERVVLTAQSVVAGKLAFGFDGAFKFAHAPGEAVREVGPCHMTGLGNVNTPTGWGTADLYVGPDEYHPSAAGKIALGQANAALLRDYLARSGRV